MSTLQTSHLDEQAMLAASGFCKVQKLQNDCKEAVLQVNFKSTDQNVAHFVDK